jgi:hypothetical protein
MAEQLLLAATLFAHDPATFGVHVSAWLGVDGWPMESLTLGWWLVRC